jgi:predicted 3-demethylubiquinone-9 3-methyltransferase (glyoxalase superfamily)
MSDVLGIRTCLWFETGAEGAARFYASLFEGAEITHIFPMRGDPEGRAFLVHWTMFGQKFSAMNGGPGFSHSAAASIEVHVTTQAEVDRLWDALTADGGKPSRCGWLTDRFGISWQIIPEALPRLMASKDDAVAQRVTQAMLAMSKLDAAALEAAAKGD